jgi:hypothetical protein
MRRIRIGMKGLRRVEERNGEKREDEKDEKIVRRLKKKTKGDKCKKGGDRKYVNEKTL